MTAGGSAFFFDAGVGPAYNDLKRASSHMLRAERLRKAIAWGVVAAWALLVSTAFADALEDARKVSPQEDRQRDQAVQQALGPPAVKPTALSWSVTPSPPPIQPVSTLLRLPPVISPPVRPAPSFYQPRHSLIL